ncbi:predicted protein [Phaeodactylum tricornutum CCAP 1055/1]|uniref:Uncharacterized protein n=1 Tax=Phaeodactylum tricornutum (strain CCAP 1055/1) TaxID=556484 RepID=B7FUP0_PHATC|nr:predicted protein [Phaeodactylum tricornutum CCAP 1055/1]EEC50020.1 predicted protein [Phaeodactylum tricornutum CCAP 1055/1]|eukprot:XP_002178355.1 predicted protein [Phaeodactylum tricornutum CCAP 1055/1]
MKTLRSIFIFLLGIITIFTLRPSVTSLFISNKFDSLEFRLDLADPSEVNITANSLDALASDTRPRNLNLAMVGDSVTRFQYISLIYFLSTGYWIDDRERPDLLKPRMRSSWNDWLNYSNTLFSPHEQCDCFRFDNYRSIENRYFQDNRNNSVIMIVKFGSARVHGFYTWERVNRREVRMLQITNRSQQFPPHAWDYNWTDLIQQHIAKLAPKPEFLVFNAGIHRHNLGSPMVQQEIQTALRQHSIIGIFKTTSFPKAVRTFQKHPVDEALCGGVFPNCVNLDWTFNVSDSHYIDKHHFDSPVNTLMNQQLLEYIGGLQKGAYGSVSYLTKTPVLSPVISVREQYGMFSNSTTA